MGQKLSSIQGSLFPPQTIFHPHVPFNLKKVLTPECMIVYIIS
jgi:hypothetical protein